MLRSISLQAAAGFVGAVAVSISTAPAFGQWTIRYEVDETLANSALGEERVEPMRKALDRAKAKLEKIFAPSIGSVVVNISWSAPPAPSPPTAAASATTSQFHVIAAATAKNKLSLRADADGEPMSETDMYAAIPTPVPYNNDETGQRSAASIVISNALNRHLQFNAIGNPSDGTIYFRPPNATLKWQFYRKVKENLENHQVFEAFVIHETFHLLGFQCAAESNVQPPPALFTWDIFRFADTDIPNASANFSTLARELRPTVEASALTAFNNAAKVYKLARGTGPGGDEYQAGHWRNSVRLTPPVPIGAMDPVASSIVYTSLGERYFTRADVDALDILGWNIDPSTIQFVASAPIDLVGPPALAQVAVGSPISLTWGETSYQAIDVYVYPGTSITGDNPVRVFYELPFGTTSVSLSGADALPAGEYVWVVVGATDVGAVSSEERRLTVVAACDSIDFNNNNVFPEDQDVIDFFAVLGGDACSTSNCNDIDFNNNNVFPEDQDVIDFFNALAGASCP